MFPCKVSHLRLAAYGLHLDLQDYQITHDPTNFSIFSIVFEVIRSVPVIS